jgi:hypothetical protein
MVFDWMILFVISHILLSLTVSLRFFETAAHGLSFFRCFLSSHPLHLSFMLSQHPVLFFSLSISIRTRGLSFGSLFFFLSRLLFCDCSVAACRQWSLMLDSLSFFIKRIRKREKENSTQEVMRKND